MIAAAKPTAPTPEDAIIKYDRLIWKLANYHLRRMRWTTLDDLYQIGAKALIEACRGFDPDHGVSFMTYAWASIYKEMKRSIQDSGVIRVPNYIWDRNEPRYEEMRHLRALGREARHVRTLFPKWGTRESDTTVGGIVDRYDPFVQEERREEAGDLLRWLHPRERRAVELSFGLQDGKDRTLEDVGKELGGVSKERARQILKIALAKMRRAAGVE